MEDCMKTTLRTVAVAASTFACAALLSPGWSEQGGVSLSVNKAEAQKRVYITRGYAVNAIFVEPGTWDAVRAYYFGGPWRVLGTATPAGLTTQRAMALAARPVPRSRAGTA
jgi:hypothetical protein